MKMTPPMVVEKEGSQGRHRNAADGPRSRHHGLHKSAVVEQGTEMDKKEEHGDARLESGFSVGLG
jgi:hypothetical protein